jgi:hypothetical protein
MPEADLKERAHGLLELGKEFQRDEERFREAEVRLGELISHIENAADVSVQFRIDVFTEICRTTLSFHVRNAAENAIARLERRKAVA